MIRPRLYSNLGPVESVRIPKGPKKSGPAFGRFSHKLALSSELFNLEIRNKTAENKSLASRYLAQLGLRLQGLKPFCAG